MDQSGELRPPSSEGSSNRGGPQLMTFDGGQGGVVDKQVLIDELATLGEEATEEEEIFHLFQILAQPPSFSAVDLDNGARVLEVIGIVFDEVSYMDLVGSRTELTYEQLRDLAIQMRALTSNTKDDDQVKQDREIEVIPVDVLTYIWKVISCQSAAPGTEYKVIGPSFEMKPRQVLITLMGSVTLVCCGLVIMTVALLWTTYAATSSTEKLRQIGIGTRTSVIGFENALIELNGVQLKYSAASIGAYGSALYFTYTESNRTTFLRRTAVLARGADAIGNATALARRTVARNAAVLLSVLPARLLVTAMRALQQGAPDLVVTEFDATISATTSESGFQCLGAACATTYPCLSSTTPSLTYHFPTRVPGGASGSAFGTMTHRNTAACVSQSYSSQIRIGNARVAVAGASIAKAFTASGTPDFLSVATIDDTLLQPTWIFATQGTTCMSGSCNGETDAAISAHVTRRPSSLYAADRAGAEAVIGAAASLYSVSFVMTQTTSHLRDWFVNNRYQDVMWTLNDVRAVHKGSTIEVVIMVKNATTGLTAQLQPPALPGGCYGVCRRSSYALVNADAGFRTRLDGWSITPDYRPEPCVSGYSYAPESTIDVTIVIERDVTEVRRLLALMLKLLIESLKLQESLEVLLVHRASDRLTKLYNPQDPCPLQTSCLVYAGYGVVYRSDCSHCSRPLDIPVSSSIAYLALPRLLGDCNARGLNCTLDYLATDPINSVSRQAIGSVGERVYDKVKDYRQVDVTAYVGEVENLTATLIIKQDVSDSTNPINTAIFISLGACAGFVFVVTAIFVVLASSLLTQIEDQWLEYKLLIANERKIFTESVREMMPAYIAEKVTSNERVTGDQQNVCIAFLDMCGSTARNGSYEPAMFARFVTYSMHMTDAFATHYNIHRVRFIGDMTILVAGLNETAPSAAVTEAAESTTEHYTVRMMRCLVNICQITGSRYAHYPHRCELLADVFGSEPFSMPDLLGEAQHVGSMMMSQSSIGVHQGSVTVSFLFFPNGAPHFDLLGPAVSLSHRLSQSAKAGCILISDAVRETCERHAPSGMLTYGKQRKIVIRGRGTANTSEIKSALVAVPNSVFHPLGIRYSRLRKYFDEEDLLKKIEAKASGSESSSVMSRSDLSSAHGGNSMAV